MARAAAMTASVSTSLAPRSASSRSTRLISNGTRNSTSGSTLRSRARTPPPSVGDAILSLRPVLTAEAAQPCGPTKSTSRRAASVVLSVRAASFSISCQPVVEIGANSRRRWFISLPLVRRAAAGRGDGFVGIVATQIADAEMPFGRYRRRRLGLFLGDRCRERFFAEEILAQVRIEGRVAATQPLEHHRRVLLLLVAVMRKHGLEIVIGRGGDALVVPVDSLQFLHQRTDGAMLVDDLGAERLGVFVQGLARHSGVLSKLKRGTRPHADAPRISR